MQKSKWAKAGLLSVVSLSMLLAGCSDTKETASTTDSKGGSTEPIKIGVVTSKSGALEGYGTQELNGLKLGIEYATGGTNKVEGRDVQLLIEDDGGKPDDGIKKARKLLEEDNVDILQGSASSSVASAIEPLAEEYKKIYMIDPAAADDLTGKNFNKYVFRTGRNSSQDSLTGGKYAVENLGKSFFALAPDSVFGKSSNAAWKGTIEKSGGKIAQEEYAPQDTQDFTPYLQKAIQSKADVLLISWAGAGGAALFKQIAELKVAEKMKVTTGIPDIAGIKAMGDGAVGLQGMTAYYYGLPKNKENDWLVEHHKKDFNGTPPDLFTAGGFTAGIAIVEGIKKAHSTDSDKLITALEGMTVHGAKGDYTFRKEDHQAIQPMYIVKLEKKDGFDYLVPTLVKEMSPEETAPPITNK
ncbi:substrate-binding domain-containing protein [Tumebacillus sp. ITR2]|uniref:Substrate-binding domain-containing protein n=1 Tax=Tumebacillus amylolyticus TaxID=2801339 RepID=A0ABS1JEJ6_9BACL|nr:substrate-binding domain-containing protein [Tumebacillus amylolyticus]MBL0388727.1 substrate-binding domain-containing protein [Tumebacillus amylolyticus]